MPMTHVHLRQGTSDAYRAAVLNGIQTTLHQAFGIPPEAFFMTMQEYDDANFHVNATFPFPRSPNRMLIQITVTAGRSATDKQHFYHELVARLEADAGVNPADVFINLLEVPSENWSPGKGLLGRNPNLAAKAA